MNDVSVSSIKLPQGRTAKIGARLARDAMFKLFAKFEAGSLTIHEGAKSYHFGNADDVNGPHGEAHIHSPSVYGQMMTGGTLGAGEAYIQGHWTSPALVDVTRVFSANMGVMQRIDEQQSLFSRAALAVAHRLNRNTQKGSKDNIAAHYDLGNDFFKLFLDPTMMYSAALFGDTSLSLEEASEAKLEEMCQRLELKASDHLLEIGTGWGGMAVYAAKHYGCHVTTTTISQEQYEYACARAKREGLEDKVTLLCEDYRDLTGVYDKLVSIEMIEAVGHQFYKNYFETCSGLLKENGKMVIQAITMADQRYEAARDSVDYIKRYVFPGGCLPSLSVIADHIATDTDMQIVHLRDITQDYAITLSHWRDRFQTKLEEVQDMGFDQQFIKMWEFYLCYCEGGFRERIISTVQLVFAKPGYRF